MIGSKRTIWGVAAVVVLALISATALIYVKAGPGGKDSVLASLATGPMKAMVVTDDPQPAPDYGFFDASGQPVRFADFEGQVTVVNLWAMWCAPCREEMPTLATLARTIPDIRVVTINVDVDDQPVANARAFLADQAPLAFYHDPKFQLPFEFPGKGAMPQTILLDRQGLVRAHLTGAADWSSDEAGRVLGALVEEP